VEGSNDRRNNRSYICIAETCILHSDCELKSDSLMKTTKNNVKSRREICKYTSFTGVDYFPWNFCLPHIIKHGIMLNHAWCFGWSSICV